MTEQLQKQPSARVPIHLISGFLGSGKTTLLNRVIDYYKAADVKVAVIMNELGDVNLDGQFVDDDVPMAEMLGGCICCTIRGDLGLELKMLIEEHQPDVVLIESTGAANPMEIIDAVTEAALYIRVELQTIATVVDGPELLSRSRRGGRTYRLMQDQIRCATDLIMNKADKLGPDELIEVQQLIRELNSYAPLTITVRCMVELNMFDPSPGRQAGTDARQLHESHVCGANCSQEGHHHPHDEQTTDMGISHSHVMALTYYFDGPVNSYDFESLISRLPDDVYRAKGIVTFSDTNSRFLFQYAYRELEFTRITPQGKVNDVAVFIGEHFAKDALVQDLVRLHEGTGSTGIAP
ncbi:CobW family GTP-binding protein [Paenibacillus nasutitermitis]|uniref:Cobalamin biosynthesis protein n=1 Tax=Paenibacillus nasutitermitis TaxID=1652958 RepID=A0A917E2Q5_9BACL|nr:GTP-binding protein [Paenibacillus nasutitermitis]GGD95317.1 cobalamin biosynthesis protein [Paenibacillus nasutitermitis]